MQLLIFTATRTSEVIEAHWDEFNLKDKVWIIPENRIKGERKQHIPLSAAALEILLERFKSKRGKYVFEGRNRSKPMSNGTLLMLRKRMGYADEKAKGYMTPHGFRSTFRDWAAEQTAFPREVVENALAHVNKDKTEAAYLRSDLFVKRIQLMDAWAKYCLTERPKEDANNVVAIRRKG